MRSRLRAREAMPTDAADATASAAASVTSSVLVASGAAAGGGPRVAHCLSSPVVPSSNARYALALEAPLSVFLSSGNADDARRRWPSPVETMALYPPSALPLPDDADRTS